MLCDKLKAFVSYTEAMTSATKIRRTRRTWSFHVIVCKDNREKYRDLWRKSAATALLINSLFGGVLAIFAAVVASGLWYCYLIWTKKQSWKQLCNIDCRGGDASNQSLRGDRFCTKTSNADPKRNFTQSARPVLKNFQSSKTIPLFNCHLFPDQDKSLHLQHRIFSFFKLAPYRAMHFNFILKSYFAVFCPIGPNACNLIFS